MYFYSVTNYKTVALHLIIIKDTLTKDLIKLSPDKSYRLETYKQTPYMHVTLITDTIKRDYFITKIISKIHLRFSFI